MENEKQDIQEERINNPDGTYSIKCIFKKTNDDSYASYIEHFSKDGNYLHGEYYKDKDFKGLLITQRIEYTEEEDMTVYKVYKDPYDKFKSAIETYDKNKNPIAHYEYANEDFTALITSEVREYEDDGSYTLLGTYIYPDYNGKSFCTEKVDKNGIIIEEIHKLTKNNKYFGTITTNFDINTKQYIQNTTLAESDNEGLKSYTKLYDSYNRLIKGQFYINSDYKKLDSTYTATYQEDGSSIAQFVYHNPQNGWHSIEEHYNSDGIYVSGEGFYDKKFKKLGWQEVRTTNENGGYSTKIIYEQPNHNGNSQILNYNSNGKFVSGEYYLDKNFNNLLKTIRTEYSEDGSYSKYVVYNKTDSEEFLPTKRFFDSTGREIKREVYQNKDFSELKYHEKYNYTNHNLSDYFVGEYTDGSGYTKGKFSLLPLTNNCFIDLRYTYKNKECDNPVKKELYYLPAGRKGTVVKLTEYYEKQTNKESALLEIFDMQHNLKYKKNFKSRLIAEFIATLSDPMIWIMLTIYIFIIVYCVFYYYINK